MICPKCGEDNSDNFRFCGMCGTLLEARVEARRPAGAPVPNLPSPTLPKIASAPEPLRPPIQSDSNQPISKQASPHLPTVDTLRETAFSGLDSFFEPEQPKSGGRRILLLVVLLAALGGAGWWVYTNYLGATESGKSEVSSSGAGGAPAEKPTPKPAIRDAAPVPTSEAGSSKAAVPPAALPESQSDSTSAAPAPKSEEATAKPATKVATPKLAAGDKTSARRKSIATSAKASSSPAPTDTGDAAFRKGEAYLYGRGVPENCDAAVKNLKAASAKSNAKARSAFGTMYATGHCVPRDLPTSYLWFALALRVDPTNQILEKDLNAVWNQMTPPERQMATRMKQ